MRRTGLPALALLILGAPQAVAAQTADRRAQASFEVSLAESTVLDAGSTLLGAAGLLSLGGRFAFGAAGALMLGSATVESSGAGSDLDLRMGYGGVLFHVTLVGSGDRYVALRGLIGAGNAKINEPVVGFEIGAENFGVIEPELVGALTLAGPLQVGLGAGYRHVFGVNDLPGIAPADLEGFSAAARLSVRIR
jgi:hypothetical protein